MNYKIIAYIGLAFIFIFSACRKDEDIIIDVDRTTVEFKGQTVENKVYGIILDTDSNPIAGAEIWIENQNIGISDQNGVFVSSIMAVNSLATKVRVTKEGYYSNIKIFPASENHSTFAQVSLKKRVPIDFLNASVDEVVEFEGGAKISFPAESVNMSNSSTPLWVHAYTIDPSNEEDVYDFVPGDFRTIDSNSETNIITDYGMIKVELSAGSNGTAEIADGKSVELTFPLAEERLGNYPEILSLYYFDQIAGYWIEDGQAVLTSDGYVGSVTHFTHWMCGYSGPTAYLTGSLVNNRQIRMEQL